MDWNSIVINKLWIISNIENWVVYRKADSVALKSSVYCCCSASRTDDKHRRWLYIRRRIVLRLKVLEKSQRRARRNPGDAGHEMNCQRHSLARSLSRINRKTEAISRPRGRGGSSHLTRGHSSFSVPITFSSLPLFPRLPGAGAPPSRNNTPYISGLVIPRGEPIFLRPRSS